MNLGSFGSGETLQFGSRSLAVSAFANPTLDQLVDAATNLSVAIQQQLATVQRDPVPADFARSTIAYAQAKTAYFAALREEMARIDKHCDRQTTEASPAGQACRGVLEHRRKTEDGGGAKDDDVPKAILRQSERYEGRAGI